MALSACPADEETVTPLIATGTPFIAIGANVAGSDVAVWVILAAMLWVAWYLLACAVFPWRACRWCDGGKKRGPSRRNWRDCRHCTGTGKRARFGRWLWKAMANRDRSHR